MLAMAGQLLCQHSDLERFAANQALIAIRPSETA
jgi:hypothetical protein